jgi:hypothetical protein
MSTERGSKTLSGCSPSQQKFRDKIKTEDLVEPDCLENVELDMEI